MNLSPIALIGGITGLSLRFAELENRRHTEYLRIFVGWFFLGLTIGGTLGVGAVMAAPNGVPGLMGILLFASGMAWGFGISGVILWRRARNLRLARELAR